ncbi:hypothetical protein M408DRAFT_304042 [Serendipita vermifera MAFF 305830]|uniref:Uncharacterized protein n=1 Tax=Serendipita vermifera MAFF 305830 TaxID=933852 RepID=A0A0C3BEZ6_SERVB|nr:hypothetical protein M408DRAFT_304042 [Serendipita vermifera MAFF 305830]
MRCNTVYGQHKRPQVALPVIPKLPSHPLSLIYFPRALYKMTSPQHKETLDLISELLVETESTPQRVRGLPTAEWSSTDLSFPFLFPSMSTPGSSRPQTLSNVPDSPLGTRATKAELDSPIRFIGRSPFMPATPGHPRSCSGLFCYFFVSEAGTFCSTCKDMYASTPPRREELWQWSSLSAFTSPAGQHPAFASGSADCRPLDLDLDPIANLARLESEPSAGADIGAASPKLGAARTPGIGDGGAIEETNISSATDDGEQSTLEESPWAASIPLPESDDEAEAEEGDGEQPQASTSNEGFSSFIHPDAPAWQWERESAVKRMIERLSFGDKAGSTHRLEGLFPPQQRHVQLADGKYRCRATAGLDKATDRWSIYRCKHTAYKHLNDYRRHLTSKHLGDERAEVRHKKNNGSSHKRKTRKDDDEDEWGVRRGQSKRRNKMALIRSACHTFRAELELWNSTIPERHVDN